MDEDITLVTNDKDDHGGDDNDEGSNEDSSGTRCIEFQTVDN